MASAVDSRLAYARLSAVATASHLPTANRGSNNSYTTSWDTTSGSHERLWRDDALYDLLVTLRFNDYPPVAGAGSAIFIHVATPNFSPTEGCVALARDPLYELLADCAPGDWLCISPPGDAEKQHQDADRV